MAGPTSLYNPALDLSQKVKKRYTVLFYDLYTKARIILVTTLA